MDSITRHQGSTYQEPFIDPMDDLDDEGFESQDIALTERASLISNGLKSSSGVETPLKSGHYLAQGSRRKRSCFIIRREK